MNRYLQPEDAPINNMPRKTTGVSFDANYEIQTRNLKVSNFVNNAGSATALGTGFVNGTSLTVDIGLSAPFGKANFGLPYIAIYQGTSNVGSLQIYPSFGAGIANQKYAITSGFDWATWNGTSSTFAVNIENNSGTTQNFFIVADWKELRFAQKKGAI